MDKGLGNETNNNSISSSSSATAANSNSSISNNRDMFLKQVNRNSHKIAKPTRKPLPLPNTAAASSANPIPDPNSLNPGLNPPQSQQPPVYNINKNDFRDVVQKLTGSPAHERFPTPPPPPVTNPRPPSSRLQRIRPPPLAQITNRPPQLIPRPQNDAGQRGAAPAQSYQPLPPLPSVHPAAESPISAYMRFLQSSASSPSPSPLWNGVPPPTGPRPDSLMPQTDLGQRPPFSAAAPPPDSPISAYMRYLQNSAASSSAPPPSFFAPQQQPSSASFPAVPLSPLPFGCIPAPGSPYGMNSPNFLFPPTGQFGLPQLPMSPTLPASSPRWKGM